MTAVAVVIAAHHLLVLGKERLGNVKVLHVVNLIPFLVSNRKRLKVRIVEQRYHAQHLLIIFVVAQGLAVSIEERNILTARKLTAELIDVYRL